MTIIGRLKQIAEDAQRKADEAETQEQMAYWRGVLFGLESAEAELRAWSATITVTVGGNSRDILSAGRDLSVLYGGELQNCAVCSGTGRDPALAYSVRKVTSARDTMCPGCNGQGKVRL